MLTPHFPVYTSPCSANRLNSAKNLALAILLVGALMPGTAATPARADSPGLIAGVGFLAGLGIAWAVSDDDDEEKAEARLEFGTGTLQANQPNTASVTPEERLSARLVRTIPAIGAVDLSTEAQALRMSGITAQGRLDRTATGSIVAITLDDARTNGDLFRWREASGHDSLGYNAIFSGSETFVKEVNTPGDNAPLLLSVAYEGSLLTVPMLETDAVAMFTLRINSPELGELFNGTAMISEDSPEPKFSGDLSGARHTSLGRGRASVRFESKPLKFPVPASSTVVTINYQIILSGIGIPL